LDDVPPELIAPVLVSEGLSSGDVDESFEDITATREYPAGPIMGGAGTTTPLWVYDQEEGGEAEEVPEEELKDNISDALNGSGEYFTGDENSIGGGSGDSNDFYDANTSFEN
jgi:hypothetical protein